MDDKRLLLDDSNALAGKWLQESVAIQEQMKKDSIELSNFLRPEIIKIYGKDPFIKVASID